MSPSEMSIFAAEEAADSIANLDMPKIRSRPELLQLNLKLAAENFLMSALIDWRHQLADPRTKLLRAYDVCKTAIETLTALTYSTRQGLKRDCYHRRRWYERGATWGGNASNSKSLVSCWRLAKPRCAITTDVVEPSPRR